MLENHGEPWTEAETERFILLKSEKKTEAEIAKILGRSKSAINGRWHWGKQFGEQLNLLELIPD